MGDVFVRDNVNLTIELVSLASDGSQGNGFSGIPSLSENGHYVVFQSYTANLVSDVTSEVRDIFIHDRTSHVTQRVSIASDGSQGMTTHTVFQFSLPTVDSWLSK